MRNYKSILIILTVSLVFLTLPADTNAANRTSLGLVGGIGLPIGWWGERWDPLQNGEISLRYEFSPGTGFMIMTGLSKAYLTSLSSEEVVDESRFGDTPDQFKQFITVNQAYQGGSFSQLPMGFGFYAERMISTLRVYGSMAMVVYNWKVERSQELNETVNLPDLDVIYHVDEWWDSQDGSDMGAQATLGFLYKLRDGLFLDCSAAFNYLNIGKKHGAFAYYGNPARVPAGEPDNQLIEDAKASVSSVQLRLGIRVTI